MKIEINYNFFLALYDSIGERVGNYPDWALKLIYEDLSNEPDFQYEIDNHQFFLYLARYDIDNENQSIIKSDFID
jgi:hypothetical protein